MHTHAVETVHDEEIVLPEPVRVCGCGYGLCFPQPFRHAKRERRCFCAVRSARCTRVQSNTAWAPWARAPVSLSTSRY